MGIILFVIVGVCIIMAGFFAGAETAFVSVDKPTLAAHAARGDRAARRATGLIASPARLMSTLLIGTNLFHVTGTSIATLIVAHYVAPHTETLVTTLVMTPLIVLFAEMVPKSLGRANAYNYTMRAAHVVSVTETIFHWAVSALSWTAQRMLRLCGVRDALGAAAVTREEVRALADISKEEGLIGAAEHRMIRRVFDMSRTRVASVMVPLVDLHTIPANSTIGEALDIATRYDYSRLPVYTERTDNIIGIVRVIDLLEASLRLGRDEPLGNLIDRSIPYMPESKLVVHMLREIRKERTPVIFIVDEYGGVSGMITLHDLAEEIVGVLAAERPEERFFLVRHRGGIECEGRTDVDVLSEKLGVTFAKKGYDTIAGLILVLAGKVPEPGASFVYKNMRLTVIRADRKRISRVRIEPLKTSARASTDRTTHTDVTPTPQRS